MAIFDIEHEALLRARPRHMRDELPYPFPNVYPTPQSWGPTRALPVTEMQVLGLPAAWRSVNLIANGLAMMAPPHAMQDDVTVMSPTPAIVERPNVTMTAVEFWHQAASVALVRGEYVGLQADFDPNTGYPNQVVPVPPGLTFCYYDAAGYAVYSIGGTLYSAEQVCHVRWLTWPGSPRGIGPVEVCRRGFNHALEQQHLAADTYARGSVPAGVIEVPLPNPDRTQTEDVQSQWIENHGSQRKPAVLPQGWSFTPLSWSPEDAQFLESRAFTVAEIAFMFGLDPTDLAASIAGSSSAITYANVEQRQIARNVEAYGPWMLRFEQAWSDMLPGRQQVKFRPELTMRLDAKTRAEVHALNLDTGVETEDEARAAEGKPPLTAAQKAERANKVPVPPMPSAAAAADAKQGDVPAEQATAPATTEGIQQ